MKYTYFLIISLVLFGNTISLAQIEKYPIYPGCDNDSISNSKDCFIDKVSQEFLFNYSVISANDENPFSVVFVATKNGDFEVLYIKTNKPSIKPNIEKAFKKLPKFKPATFNGHRIEKQFIISYPNTIDLSNVVDQQDTLANKDKNTYPINHSPLQIPYSITVYRQFQSYENNGISHTAVKPYIYSDVSKYIDLDSRYNSLLQDRSSWFGRKFWNENMLDIQEEDYWFHLDPVADLQIGKDNSENNYTFNNTRAIRVEGGLGKRISFSSTLFESQGRFATYFNRYARYIKPSTDGYAVIPGRDISKNFNLTAFDYPLTTGTLSIQAMDKINIQLGQDRNFIGDGYRSLFLSDVGAPYTFIKINSTFWHIRYTNIWTWLRDVNIPTATNEPYKRKYMALHYLSWNATKKLNIGLFESVVWAKTEDRGFDPQYLNPVIFYRALEFSNGSKSGNALLGFSINYQLNKDIKTYSQFVLDELTMSEFVKKDGYWANKYGVQVGVKYYNALKIPNLYLQLEYNQVRPYTYSHSKPEINYGHVNQPLAHLWGSNFKEMTFIADYYKNRWFANLKITKGIKGFDYETNEDSFSYGGDIFKPYTDRNDNFGVFIGQGNKATIFIGELKAGYLINPATNLKIFGEILLRNFDSASPNPVFENKYTTWFNIGFRTDINNWYFDF